MEEAEKDEELALDSELEELVPYALKLLAD